MKKLTVLAVAIAMSASAFAQSNAGLSKRNNSAGQEIKTTATQGVSDQEKGQAVSEVAKLKSAGARAEGAEAASGHGQGVSAVATDNTLAGREKGEAVKAVASSKSGSIKPAQAGKPADAGKPASVGRPARAAKPAGAGRPSGAGRPVGSGRPSGAGRPAGR